MKRIAVLAIAMVCVAGMAFGADSKTNRATKTVGVTYALLPLLHFGTLFAPPIGIDWIANDHFTLGGEFGSGGASVSDSGNKATVDFSNMGARARWFPGTNSFYLGAAVNQRSFTGTATVDAKDSTTGLTATAKGTVDSSATVAAITLGNQWTFDFGMTITADWLILSGAVGSSSTSKIKASVSGVTLNTSQTADAEKNLKDIGDFANLVMSAPGFLVISFGWSF